MKFSDRIVKHRFLIICICLILMIPSILGMMNTRINYDMLTYLPKEIDTIKGQDILYHEFGKGAFSLIVVDNKNDQQIIKLCDDLNKIDHVESVISYPSLTKGNFIKEMLSDEILENIYNDDKTLIAIFFDTSTSADATIKAINDIRSVCDSDCYVSGMSALVSDLKALCEHEEPIYVALAVGCALLIMLLLLDNYMIPFIFLLSIGAMILLNLGTNYFLGEISYVTKALSAVLQLAVTIDYSIFLWHSYQEELLEISDKSKAMSHAISKTLRSIVGSSITTIAGFVALCFMSFALGKDLGIVMAKGVIFGVIGCITLLPCLILVLDPLIAKFAHKPLLPKFKNLADNILKWRYVTIILTFVLLIFGYYGYYKTNQEVYYDMGSTLPKDVLYIQATEKLSEDFNIASTHMLLVDDKLDRYHAAKMIDDMENVEGVKYVIALDKYIGEKIPLEILPDELISKVKNEKWQVMLINSVYKTASDDVNKQIDELNHIVKQYDDQAMLIGEAPCMKDMIQITDNDFKVVNTISILAIFIIIALVEKSIILPIILIAIIELAIFINLGIPHYFHQSLPFIAPICVSTIQLGATVDYAILLTNRYKYERKNHVAKDQALKTAINTSLPSIIVSGLGLFGATFGVAIYSDIDIISSLCFLMAKGALISMICVVFILPSFLYVFDEMIIRLTLDMKGIRENHEKTK